MLTATHRPARVRAQRARVSVAGRSASSAVARTALRRCAILVTKC